MSSKKLGVGLNGCQECFLNSELLELYMECWGKVLQCIGFEIGKANSLVGLKQIHVDLVIIMIHVDHLIVTKNKRKNRACKEGTWD